MESHYDIKAWAEETKLGQRIFNYNFRIQGHELKGWQLLKAVPMHKDARLAEVTYLVQSEEAADRQMVRMNIAELADWRAAQKHLLAILDHSMRPDLPRGTGKLGALGDISLVARAPQSDIPAAVQFARGNIAVAVNSVGTVTIDVSEIAATVDHLLTEPPAKLPSIRKLSKPRPPKAVLLKGKEGATLVKDLKKVRDAWLKVIVPDGELRRKGDALVYISRQPGKKVVRIYAINVRTG